MQVGNSHPVGFTQLDVWMCLDVMGKAEEHLLNRLNLSHIANSLYSTICEKTNANKIKGKYK